MIFNLNGFSQLLAGIPLNIDWQQILLHLFNFAIIFAILFFLLYKPVKNFMYKRSKHFEDLQKETSEKLLEAEKTKAEYEQQLKDAEKEIAAKREEAEAKTANETKLRIEEAENQARSLVADATQRAKAEHDKILDQAKHEITDLVTAATEKIVLNTDINEVYDSFLDTAEKENGGKNKK